MHGFTLAELLSDASLAVLAQCAGARVAQRTPFIVPSYAGYQPPMDDDAVRRWHALMTQRPVGPRRRVA